LKNVVTYSTVHSRLRKLRGVAAEQVCSNCGKQAYAWAYMHDCEDELIVAGRIYCLHIEHYSAMCDPCHKKFDGLKYGEKNGNASLTESVVIEIRHKYATGQFTTAELATVYGVARTTVSAIIAGETWAHLPVLTDYRTSGRAKLSYQQAEEIRAAHSSGEVTPEELSSRYEVNKKVIWKILTNRTYKYPGIGIRGTSSTPE
jgi:hypothetical protein